MLGARISPRRYRRASRTYPVLRNWARCERTFERALRDKALPERKAVMTVVAEIRVRDRGYIQPVFRVPVFGPPYGSVPPAGFEREGRKDFKSVDVAATYILE